MPVSITIGGKRLTYEGNNVTIRNGTVMVDGKVVTGGEKTEGLVIEKIEGATNIEAYESLTIHGNVQGDVDARKSLSCGDVEGDVRADSSVNCGDINGDLYANGSANCGDVGGNVNAGRSVNCGDVRGKVL